MLLQMVSFHSFLRLSNIPVYICAILSLAIPLLMDILVASMFNYFKYCGNEHCSACVFSKHGFLWMYVQRSCCCSVAKLCPTLCDPMDCSTRTSLSLTISRSSLKFMSIESVMLSNHFHPLLLSSPFAFNLSQHQGLFQ